MAAVVARGDRPVNRHTNVTGVCFAGTRDRVHLSRQNSRMDGLRMCRFLPPFLLVLLVAVGLADPAVANPAHWRSEGWKTDFSKTEIDFGQIMSGGPPRDGIPPIDDPRFMPVGKSELADREPVIAFRVGDDARAYPLSVLIWHEIVNDTVGGVPVAVTYCPLCDAAVVFERTVGGKVLRFGTTGKLRNSDLVMWDDATESWWQQFVGRGIVGAHTGTELVMLPSRVESFARFRDRHPNGRVLAPTDPGLRRYGANPYVGYDESPWPFLYRGDVPEGIFPMERVVKVGDKAWTLALLEKMKEIRSADGLVLRWEPGQATALGDRAIAEGRDIGNVTVLRDGKDVVHDVTFVFAFHAFVPDGMIYVACAPGVAAPKPPLVCF
jgi:hypothetical protein